MAEAPMDEKLVEAVAEAVKYEGCYDPKIVAELALRAIDASGTHWVAPWEVTSRMIEAVVHRNSTDRRYGVDAIVTTHRDARDACLAERRGRGRMQGAGLQGGCDNLPQSKSAAADPIS